MTTIKQKTDHVRKAKARNETFDHHCHWTGCTKKVPPAMWGCSKHWFRLPLRLRNKIWKCYQPEQEITKDPSDEYLTVAREVQTWIKEYGEL